MKTNFWSIIIRLVKIISNDNEKYFSYTYNEIKIRELNLNLF